ncbi:hypothetical protein LCGC14_2523410 [marine sediment metagenome]|uniref:Core-binding (CB) domain-containing protein n=1 Tax=marine sediment metagenome TaxID=412755 RepID=A0A0F9AW55_9ZZZZ
MGIDLCKRAIAVTQRRYNHHPTRVYTKALRDVEKWLRELGSIERADDLKRILEEIDDNG